LRWFIVKLINLIIVLVLVTFIVAAIFTGPLAAKQRDEIREAVQLSITTQLSQPGGENLIQTIVQEYVKYLQENGLPVPDDPEQLEKEALDWYINRRVELELKSRGLDAPWYVLSLRYTKMMLTFEPINSTSRLTTKGFFFYEYGDPNAYHIILERVPFSILLFTTSSIITLIFAIPLALYGSRNPGGIVDNVITAWSIFSVSMPWWWLAMVFIYLFTQKYKIFPSVIEGIDTTDIGQLVSKAALPVITVVSLSIGDTAYRMRNILLDVFNEDFVMVARAKGVPETLVLRKHVLRAAAPPIVTIVLFSIVLSVFAGAIITEMIFEWPGLGKLYWDAITLNDVAVLTVLTYITTLIYLLTRFFLDILYVLLDPRIRRA